MLALKPSRGKVPHGAPSGVGQLHANPYYELCKSNQVIVFKEHQFLCGKTNRLYFKVQLISFQQRALLEMQTSQALAHGKSEYDRRDSRLMCCIVRIIQGRTVGSHLLHAVSGTECPEKVIQRSENKLQFKEVWD